MRFEKPIMTSRPEFLSNTLGIALVALSDGALAMLSVSREFIEATKGFEVVCNREFSCLW